jgi:16S rRNA (guanine(966)-N(2))-methyltransferase RsmD
MLRIIGGERRGMMLETLPGQSTRPLRGRVREALFNVLQFDVQGRRVLDLFAGSGAVGIEALSRGAESAVFVEANPGAAKVVARNLAKTRYDAPRARVLVETLPHGLIACQRLRATFDLVFMMPPYHSGLADPILARLVALGLLAPGARVVVELHTAESLEIPPGLFPEREKTYGITRLHFLEATDAPVT